MRLETVEVAVEIVSALMVPRSWAASPLGHAEAATPKRKCQCNHGHFAMNPFVYVNC